MSDGSAPRLHLSGITKQYPGVLANDHVDLTVTPGEIHALLGENGAGKSTLMKIVSGQYSADHGTVTVQGHHLAPGNTRDAVKHGVAIVPAGARIDRGYDGLREPLRRPGTAPRALPEPSGDDR